MLAVRAERLRVLLAAMGDEPALSPAEAAEAADLTAWDRRVLETVTAEDMALANACLAVSREHRARNYDDLERLLACVAAEPGDLSERMLALPPERFAPAALAVLDLGWCQ